MLILKSEATPPKKPKVESLCETAESRRFDAASPASTASISSMATCVVAGPLKPEHSSSLTSIQSYNNEWESSSDDEREALQNPAKPARKSTDPPSVLKDESGVGEVNDYVENKNAVVINPNLAAMVPIEMEELRNIVKS